MAIFGKRALFLVAMAASAPLAVSAGAWGGNCFTGCTDGRQDQILSEVDRVKTVVEHKGSIVTDCARRLNEYHTRSAACLFAHDSQVLLVKVPYGSAPGWDLPGGQAHAGEPACETAEREVCEETGSSARVIRRLTYNVYLCEITGENVCTRPVDEGFLPRQWFTANELNGLKLRGHTWGDKLGLLRRQLGNGNEASTNQTLDGCGCWQGHEGWSSPCQCCAANSTTEDRDVATCRR